MSTRSKTRSSRVSESISASQNSKNRTRAHSAHSDDMDVDASMGEGKENVKALIYKAPMPPPSRTRMIRPRRAKARESLRTVDCICTKGNDGSPMIFCSKCHIWYHFTCVDLTEPDAEEISAYVCPTCTESTGCHSAMAWEGDDAVEENTDDDLAIAARRQAALKIHKKLTEPKPIVGDSDESSSSEDEYVEEKDDKGQVRDKLKGRLHRLSIVSDSDAIAASSRRISKHSASPSPSVQHLKRKALTVQHSSSPPPSKKKKSKDSAVDDPVRKYCLSKLEELFKDVFLRYPHVEVLKDVSETPRLEAKKLEELSDEENDALVKRSELFSQDLEKCVFDIYAEPDRNGQPHASGKYKERFRMLQFNLSKVDRVIIHQRITSGTISPKEISLMSSTDLADEETKQSIKLAEKEALEHSILLKSTMPRAKITHKGLQDIEDVNGEVATAHEIEVNKEREQEEEERRERERMARLRTSQRQRTASVSVPPESPTVHSSTASLMGEQLWGGPPPVPVHAMSPTVSDFSGSGSRPPLFMHTSDLNTTELELNLADLINIDDEQDSTNQMPMFNIGTNIVSSPVDAGQSAPPSVTPTGISPFAARPERQRGASFDLNSLWNMAKDDVQQSEASPAPAEPPASETATATVPTPTENARDDGSDKDEAMELESVEANDQDFDMFLEEKEPESEQNEELIVTPIPPRNVDALPQVWKGTLSMPLDSTVPQETFLTARQIAGRPLPAESSLWKTLFPSDNLRIEGRVAVDNSIKYLVGMRLNAAKELYAAAFTPSAPEHDGDFKAFCNFLIAKGRHGLVFPWGSRPKDYHPGRELYMVPLLQTDPLPEFVELLDELKLPKIRDKDYLLGIWILNKGKLAVLPSPPAPPASVPVITPQPSQSHSPPIIPPLFNNLPPPSVSMPQPPLPPQIPMPPPTNPGLPIAPSALAAEVASLTPEQLQEVLRTLSSTMLPSLTQPVPPAVPPPFNPIQQPPIHHTTPPIGVPTPPMGQTPPSIPPAQSAWIPPPMTSYSNYPPPNVPFQQPPTHNTHNVHNAPRNPGLPPPPFDRQDHDRQDYNRQNYSRDYQPQPGHNYQQSGNRNSSERGWRGNSGNRGGNPRHSNQGQRNNRGRGGGGAGGSGSGDGHDFNNRRDSGWPRRQRNEGHSGPSW